MDSITHIFLGASIGQAVANKKTNHKAAILGALASSAPDFDVFVQSSQHPLWTFTIHRSITHSLLFIPFGALLVFMLAMLLFKSLREDWRIYLWVCLLAYGSHCLLDSCTSYGTELFWPFANTRVSWDIIPIVEPVFTIFLIVGFSFSWRKAMAKPAIIGLVAALVYLGFCAEQHQRALTAETQLIQSREQIATEIRVMPAFANIYQWNGLYVSHARIYSDVIKTPLFGKAYAVNGFSMPQFSVEQLPHALQNPEFLNAAQVLLWFSQSYVSVAQDHPFTIVDMRYLNKSSPLTAMWGLSLLTQQSENFILRVSRVLIDPDEIEANH